MRAQGRGRRNRVLGDGQSLSHKLLLLLRMQGQSPREALLLAGRQALLRGGLSQHSGKVLRLHQTDTGPNIESYRQAVSSLVLHLRRMWAESGRYTVYRGRYESDTLHSVFPQEIRSALLRLQAAHNARAWSGRDHTSGGVGSQFPHPVLQVRGLRIGVVVRLGGARLLSPGRSHPVQKLQRYSRPSLNVSYDDRIINYMDATRALYNLLLKNSGGTEEMLNQVSL